MQRNRTTRSGAGGWSSKGSTILIALLVSVFGNGCFDAPGIEERWTRLELIEVRSLDGPFARGDSTTLLVHARITYRQILTGAVVAEVRTVSGIVDGNAILGKEEAPVEQARKIDWVIENSTSLGGASQEVTGYDHLIQDFRFEIRTALPMEDAAMVLLFFGEPEEIEVDGEEVEIVVPIPSEPNEILPAAFELVPETP
jgi:hypothetical protein